MSDSSDNSLFELEAALAVVSWLGALFEHLAQIAPPQSDALSVTWDYFDLDTTSQTTIAFDRLCVTGELLSDGAITVDLQLNFGAASRLPTTMSILRETGELCFH